MIQSDKMQNLLLEIKVSIQIQKSAEEVFEAIVDPAKMSNYFLAKGNARMDEAAEVVWQFPEFSGEFTVKVNKHEPAKHVSFYWDGDDGKPLLVEISLTPKNNNDTMVTITEKSRENNEAGIKWLKGNTEGWANFLACLKAYLEYGINLRKGAFDFLRSDS
jgi:uncharacterized protein YndB with AHSA1/START domain